MYYAFRRTYPLDIIKFKDRIFAKDLTKTIVAMPFADLKNKFLSIN